MVIKITHIPTVLRLHTINYMVVTSVDTVETKTSVLRMAILMDMFIKPNHMMTKTLK